MTCTSRNSAARFTVMFVTIVATVVSSYAMAGQNVVVHMASGRTFTAEVSDRTNAERLWLSFRTQSAELLRPIAWSHVASGELDGNIYEGSKLRDILLTTPVSLHAQSEDAAQEPQSEEPEVVPTPPVEGNMADEALDLLFSTAPIANSRVASVQFDAHLANWDGDVEADGLIVHVVPVNSYGHVVPASGHIEVQLHAARRIAFHEGPHKRGRRIDRLGRWVKKVTPYCMDANGCWFKLPFQADHPEFNSALGTTGLVHVKLVVPGDGVFETSIDGVRVRPFAPLRDDLEQVEGYRFLATERTGRGKRSQ